MEEDLRPLRDRGLERRCKVRQLLSFAEYQELTTLYWVRYLSEADFVTAIAPASDFDKISRQQYGILFRIADSKKQGKVSWEDFVAFETQLQRPDAEFEVPSSASSRPCAPG